ncbi:MAG TPA: hypothetical protein VFZ61_18655 [Polyangiales bacterium]
MRYVCSFLLGALLPLGDHYSSAQPAAPPAEGSGVASKQTAALTTANPSEYQRLMSLGLDEFSHGHWAEARALFLRGHALSPNARSFRALGMTAFNLRRYPEALHELTQALDDPRRPLTKSLVASTRALQEQADTFVGRYTIQLEPENAALRVDGSIAKPGANGELLLAVGSHWLEAEAQGYTRLTRPLLVDGTDGETLRLTLLPRTAWPTQPSGGEGERSPTPPRPDEPVARSPWRAARQTLGDYRWSFILGTGALGFAAGATVVQVKANEEAERVKQQCETNDWCSPMDDPTLRRDQLQATSVALWLTCGMLTVTTLVMLFVEKGRVRDREAIKRALPR